MGLPFSAGVEESCKPMYDRRMNVTLTTFHDRVHWLLRQRDMSQKELAAAVGVSEQFLSALLKGKRKPNVRRLSAMALVLQTSVDFLALLSDDPTPPQAAPEPAPVYFSAEADAAAQLIDAMPPARQPSAWQCWITPTPPPPTPTCAPSCASPSTATACRPASGCKRTASRAPDDHSTASTLYTRPPPSAGFLLPRTLNQSLYFWFCHLTL